MTTDTDGYCRSELDGGQKRFHSQWRREVRQEIVKVYDQVKPYGVHATSRLRTAGFTYTKNGDTTRCESCGLEVSGWIREMDPFEIHRERSPSCSFIRSVLSKNKLLQNHQENSMKRQKTEVGFNSYDRQFKFIEINILQAIRRRTFSNWPPRASPTKEQMIRAGFFQCNVGDRVICLYCYLICQQWQGDADDPVETHKILSPQCPYVRSILTQEGPSSVFIVNELSTNITNDPAVLLDHAGRSQFDQIVNTSPCHANYRSIPSRQATFETWTNELLPSVDDLVRAGFFYTGVRNSVTCFYCNGSLQNWAKNDNPLVEHIRWYPLCQYAKQLAGNELYNKIQEAKRVRRAHERSEAPTNTADGAPASNHPRLQITDEKLLTRLVAARLDLPISQRLLDQHFKLSVIKRCWEDQLRLKQDDFVSECDLYVACLILQKQIERINGNKDNITIPSKKMESIRAGEQSNIQVPEQLPSSAINAKANAPVTSTAPEPMATEQAKTDESVPDTISTLNNPCVLCWKEEKRLACIPCGHLASCVNCSQALRTCPVCGRGIEAFVRIYL